MVPSGRCAQVVKPNGTLVQFCQYCCRRHHVDLDADAGLLPLLDHGLHREQLPVGLRAGNDLRIDAVGIAGILQQRLRLGDVLLDEADIRVLGMRRRDVVMLACACPSPRCAALRTASVSVA